MIYYIESHFTIFKVSMMTFPAAKIIPLNIIIQGSINYRAGV